MIIFSYFCTTCRNFLCGYIRQITFQTKYIMFILASSIIFFTFSGLSLKYNDKMENTTDCPDLETRQYFFMALQAKKHSSSMVTLWLKGVTFREVIVCLEGVRVVRISFYRHHFTPPKFRCAIGIIYGTKLIFWKSGDFGWHHKQGARDIFGFKKFNFLPNFLRKNYLVRENLQD